MKTLTLQECKDQVAKEYGYRDWYATYEDELSYHEREQLINKAATLFAEQDKWVSVSDKMPDEMQDVLAIITEQGKEFIPFSCVYKNGKFIDDDYEITDAREDWSHKVTHWQPLPAAPKSLTP